MPLIILFLTQHLQNKKRKKDAFEYEKNQNEILELLKKQSTSRQTSELINIRLLLIKHYSDDSCNWINPYVRDTYEELYRHYVSMGGNSDVHILRDRYMLNLQKQIERVENHDLLDD